MQKKREKKDTDSDKNRDSDSHVVICVIKRLMLCRMISRNQT